MARYTGPKSKIARKNDETRDIARTNSRNREICAKKFEKRRNFKEKVRVWTMLTLGVRFGARWSTKLFFPNQL